MSAGAVRRGSLGLVLAMLAGGAGACSAGTKTITVLVPTQLRHPFQQIAARFEFENRHTSIQLEFDRSDVLAQRIRLGAKADVFVSTSSVAMDQVARRPGVAKRAIFAKDRLTIIVPTDNPGRIRSIDDLARRGVKVVLAAPGVPQGDDARAVLGNAGIAKRVLHNVVSNEVDVEGVVAKVASGDADAGIVFVTDAATNTKRVPIPRRDNVTTAYEIAELSGAADPDLAATFLTFLLGPGRSALRSDGLLPP